MEARQIGISSTPLVLRNRQSLVNFSNMRRSDMKEIQHIVLLNSLYGEPLLFDYIRSYCLKGQLLSPQYFTIRTLQPYGLKDLVHARAWFMMGLKSVDVYVLEILVHNNPAVRSYPYNELNASALKTPHCGDYKRFVRRRLFVPDDIDETRSCLVFAWSRVTDHDTIVKLLKGSGISGLLEWYQDGIGLEEVDSGEELANP